MHKRAKSSTLNSHLQHSVSFESPFLFLITIADSFIKISLIDLRYWNKTDENSTYPTSMNIFRNLSNFLHRCGDLYYRPDSLSTTKGVIIKIQDYYRDVLLHTVIISTVTGWKVLIVCFLMETFVFYVLS